MKKNFVAGILFFVGAVLFVNSVHAQEAPMDYKQLIAKCGESIKQARSYSVKTEYKNSFTINSQESSTPSAELSVSFVSPDKFKVAQVVNEGSGEDLWDGWIVLGNDYYVLNPAFGWAKENDENRKAMCKAYSPDGVVKQLGDIEKGYKRDSVNSATEDGVEYFVIKYIFGKESVDVGSLPPALQDGKISGTFEVWINKESYLPSKLSEEVSYYSNEENKGTSSTNTSYFSYNDDKMKIDEPVLGSKTF